MKVRNICRLSMAIIMNVLSTMDLILCFCSRASSRLNMDVQPT